MVSHRRSDDAGNPIFRPPDPPGTTGECRIPPNSCDPEHIASDSPPPTDPALTGRSTRPEERDPELEAERAALERIRRVQAAYLEKAINRAARLAEEAAEMTEEGIKDIFDEDAEADAAVQAALVRQTSERAMHAVRRVGELQAAGRALAFGHTADQGGNRSYVGRLTVLDGDEPLLIDWRAPAAVPFYQATPLKRMGVERRRNFLYGDAGSGTSDDLVSYSDELFDVDAAASEIGLRGEAALLASVSAPTQDQMRTVVATIQAEQDAIIRAPGDEPLVVQGGPGTGKTVVALHRAAYLLYAQREALSDTGVLIIGPTSEFLTYIAGVLPSLGETGVLSVTAPELYPGVRRGAPEDEAVAEVKGRLDMATLLSNAVVDRQRRPTEPLNAWYGARRVTLGVDILQDLFDRARQYVSHNEGADFFRFEVMEALTQEVFDPSFHNRDDARDHFRRSEAVHEFLLRHWPSLTPEQALNDLFGSRALLGSAARGTELKVDDLELVHRPRAPHALVGDIHWSNADIPLLDELLALLGISLEGRDDDERIKERDERDEFEQAAEVDRRAEEAGEAFDDEDDLPGFEVADDDLGIGGMFDTSILDERFEVPE
ncbi:MAG: hypothetical protein AAGA65_00065 [Actinomycetota bacterium]